MWDTSYQCLVAPSTSSGRRLQTLGMDDEVCYLPCTHPHSVSLRSRSEGRSGITCLRAAEGCATYGALGSGMKRQCSADLSKGGRGWGWPVGGKIGLFLFSNYFDIFIRPLRCVGMQKGCGNGVV